MRMDGRGEKKSREGRSRSEVSQRGTNTGRQESAMHHLSHTRARGADR